MARILPVLVRGTQGLHIQEAPSESRTLILEGMLEKLFKIKTKREKMKILEQLLSNEEMDAQQLEEFIAGADEPSPSSGHSPERPGFLRSFLLEIVGLKNIFCTRMDTVETKIEGIDTSLRTVETTVQEIKMEIRSGRSANHPPANA